MYAIAPVSGLINTHVISFDTGTEGGKDATGDTTLTGFTAEKKHWYGVHGCVLYAYWTVYVCLSLSSPHSLTYSLN